MTDFVLRTRTERSLYVEALLSCIDRGSVSTVQACQDIEDICRTAGAISENAIRATSQRINGIIAAYQAHTIDTQIASRNLLKVINSVAPAATY